MTSQAENSSLNRESWETSQVSATASCKVILISSQLELFDGTNEGWNKFLPSIAVNFAVFRKTFSRTKTGKRVEQNLENMETKSICMRHLNGEK
jgi:hypothetical protein